MKLFNIPNKKIFIIFGCIFGIIIIFSGWFIFNYKKLENQKNVDFNQIDRESNKQSEVLPKKEQNSAVTPALKIYRNKQFGFEFQYPANWNVNEDSRFVQLQEVENEKVVGIVGGISIIKKPINSPIDYPYAEMFVSNSRCPIAAGSRNLSSQSQYEEYVYCLTGKEVQNSAGIWKEAVECSTSAWYGGKLDPLFCPHQFWIDTKDFFYVVHFNFFEPIKDNSNEAIFFERLLKSFSFFSNSEIIPLKEVIP